MTKTLAVIYISAALAALTVVSFPSASEPHQPSRDHKSAIAEFYQDCNWLTSSASSAEQRMSREQLEYNDANPMSLYGLAIDVNEEYRIIGVDPFRVKLSFDGAYGRTDCYFFYTDHEWDVYKIERDGVLEFWGSAQEERRQRTIFARPELKD